MKRVLLLTLFLLMGAVSAKCFAIDETPSLDVNVQSINFGEVPINESVTRYVKVTGVDLEAPLGVTITGVDFSFVQATGWDEFDGGILLVTYAPTGGEATPQYTSEAQLIISSGQMFWQSVSLTGAIADAFTFTTNVPDAVYPSNTEIPITGSVTNTSGTGVPDVEVEVAVFVDGMKRTIQVITDSNGTFSTSFEPIPYESGHYTVNSGRVGNNSTDIHDEFDILGMMVSATENIVCTVEPEKPKTDSILIRNKSNVEITNIQIDINSAPLLFTLEQLPLNLEGQQEGYLVFTIMGYGGMDSEYYYQFPLTLTSDQGAEAPFTLWYYCTNWEPTIKPIPGEIITSVTVGESEIVDVMIVNTGEEETGVIYFMESELEFMSLVGPDSLPSLAPKDTAYFSLRFSPDENVALDTYYDGINYFCDIDEAYVPVEVTVVSETTGSLEIDVTDDYTFPQNKAEEPHVAGADVSVTAYHSLELISHGQTDSNGLFHVSNLPVGYYRLDVSADGNHAQYSSTIHISKGEKNRQVYLQYMPVSYSWDAKSKKSTDDYTFDLSIDYNTSAPVPVITIDHSGVHELEYGQSEYFNILVTNHGSVEAHNIQLGFTKSSEYVFLPLYDHIETIEPLGSVEIPGTYYRMYNRSGDIEPDCDVHITAISMYYTAATEFGEMSIQDRSLPFDLGGGPLLEPLPTNLSHGIPTNNITPDNPFSSLIDPNDENEGTPVVKEQFGIPCMESLSDALGACSPMNLPGDVLLTALAGATTSIASDGPVSTAQLLLDQLSLFAGDALEYENSGLWRIKDCLLDTYTELEGCATRTDADDLQDAINGLYNSTFYYYTDFVFVQSIFSDEIWNDEANIVAFINAFKALISTTDGKVSDTDAQTLATSFVGTSVTSADILGFVERWNRSVDYWSNGYFVADDSHTDFIQIDDDLINDMLAIETQYTSIGYSNMFAVYEESVANGNAIIGDATLSRTTNVKKSFAQKSVMAGETLEETFIIHNGHSSEPLQAIGLDFVVKDEHGNDCTDLFEITTLTLNQITGIDGSGVVEPGSDGFVKIQYIPSRLAAPTESKDYYFGCSFTFIDPYTSSAVVRDLYPVAITINPGPDLHVVFFMPRDIIGDDPLTLDTYEHSVPVELGVMISNNGVVMAKNVTLETAKPNIVDQDGNEIDFSLYGTMFNGSTRMLGLMEIPFGNIESTQTSVGEWQFTSEQLARFESYDAHVIHNSSSGNSDLSLVSYKAIHELVHPVYAYGDLDDGINDFLVNDVPDENDMPDSLYFSHGGRTAVNPVQSISYDHEIGEISDYDSDIEVVLTIHPSSAGWNYGVIDDPGLDKFQIVSCKRDIDNQSIPMNNIWQTSVTLREGTDPVHENMLHILDTLPDNSQDYTYTLKYHLSYDLLDVDYITGFDSNTDQPVESILVYFTDPIIDSTFTYEDMTLTCNDGPNLMNSSVVVTKNEYDPYYKVAIPSITNESGVYVLTVSSMHVKDSCGYEGYKEKQVTWTQTLADYTQTNNLTEGWNWWSPVVNMSSEADFDKLKTALGSNASMIKSRTNGFVSYYDGEWYGTLSMLNNSEMYMIEMDSDQPISIIGPAATLSGKTITLNPGWNWISYPASGSQSVALALTNLSPAENDILKLRNTFATYSATDGWVGTLSTLNPGEGYLYNYHGSGTVDFVYAPPSKEGGQPEKANGSNHWEMAVGEYDLNATLIGVIEVEGQEQREETLSVGAFIGDRCVGQANALYIESRDRYMVFLNYFGAPNDEITFRMYDETNGVEYGISETTTLFETNAVLGTLEAPVAIRFNTVSVSECYVKNLNLFPNPVKSNEKVKISMKEDLVDGMDLEVLSSLGVVIHKAAVNDNVFELTAPLTTGVYIIKITSNEGVVYYGKLFVE